MQHRDSIVLNKILTEIDLALEMITGKDFTEFNSSELLKRAICMTVINIGELVKSLSDEIRSEHKEIPWKSIAGFRDIAAHKYQTLQMQDVYHTVTVDFPQLKDDITKII